MVRLQALSITPHTTTQFVPTRSRQGASASRRSASCRASGNNGSEPAEGTSTSNAPPPAMQEDTRSATMARIKSFGIAGTLSYVITEIAFWAFALPAAWWGYHASSGEWLSWDTDRAQLVGLAAAFVTTVRFAVPLRMAAALALVPTVQRALEQRQGQGQSGVQTGMRD